MVELKTFKTAALNIWCTSGRTLIAHIYKYICLIFNRLVEIMTNIHGTYLIHRNKLKFPMEVLVKTD